VPDLGKTRIRRALPSLVVGLLAWTTAVAGPAARGQERPVEAGRGAMELSSPAFEPGDRIPDRHTCAGEDLSPPLTWRGAPEGVRSFTLIMDDPDAPAGTWVHWVLYDLPAGATGIEEGVPENLSAEGGGSHGVCWGVRSYGRVGYHGPCPPPGKPHHYSFRLYALDTRLDLPGEATKEQVERAMEGHVLARAELVGLYGR